MTTAAWALGQLLGVAFCVGLVIGTRVLLDALSLYHHAGMARVHNDRKATR